MPRPAKGARLWLRPERRDASGKVTANAVWIIKDGGRQIATGCAASEIGEAERKLKEYIGEKYEPSRQRKDIEEIDIADVLSIYLDDIGPSITRQKELESRILRLAKFFGGKMLSDITPKLCNRYVDERGTKSGAWRELADLRSAINHHAKQNLHFGRVLVTLPEPSRRRERWLTRDEAARLLWACWRTKEVQRVHRGDRAGSEVATRRYPLRHIARFILIGLYTGTRSAAIAAASPVRAEGRSYVDLDAGIFYRLAIGRRETNKRQPPVPVPDRLLAHMRRWHARDLSFAESNHREPPKHIVSFNGKPVQSVKKGFARAVELAKLDESQGSVTPHVLRHTAATWLMQAGVEIWEAAGFLGMSPEILEKVYGHHSPNHLRGAATKIGYRHAKK